MSTGTILDESFCSLVHEKVSNLCLHFLAITFTDV